MKILLLFSGGLDSLLCYKILQNKNYHLKTIQFYTPFLHINNIFAYKENFKNNYNINLEIKNIWNDYKNILIAPAYGYGKNLNPCLDCKLLFYKKAKEIMEKENFDFIATGEIVGQRPFSQRRDTINFLEKKSGLKNKILRPLCYSLSAQIEKESFFNIKGRGRKKQLELAKDFNIYPIPTPSGGCLLTEPTYCAKLKILYNFLENNREKFLEIFFELIKYGRVFQIGDNLVIIGRNKYDSENFERLFKTNNDFCLIKSKNYPAPVTAVVSKNNCNISKKVFEKIEEFVKKDYKGKVEFEIIRG